MRYKRSSYRKLADLLSLGPEFRNNRSFNCWTDIFRESLEGVRSNAVNKPRTYEQLAKRYPKKIIKIFLELLCEDLIYNDVSYVLNHRHKKERRLTIRMAAYYPDGNGPVTMRDGPETAVNRKSYYNHGGMKYGLRIDRDKDFFKNRYSVGFYFKNRRKVRELLMAGKRYYNSYKEKIYSQL